MTNALESPVIQIDSLKTKFDTVVVSNSLIALLDYNYSEARFLQQLHYWSYSQYGVIIDGIRWIYKSAREWLNEALVGLTEWKLRKAIASLLRKNLIRREKLFSRHQEQEYKSFWWQPRNQTYYYSINYEELENLIKTAETTENVRFVEFTELSIEETETTKSCELSRNSTKNTNQRKITNKQEGDCEASRRHRHINKSNLIAAASPKKAFKEGESQTGSNLCSERLTAIPGQNKRELEVKQSNPNKEVKAARVDYKVNKELIALLDSTGIPINKTIRDLLKLYPSKKVEGAIALLKARKRDQHIPNLSGYFVAALKGDWESKTLTVEESEDSEVDKRAVFRHWYDLARELGYCSGQELREGQQWICLSGSWENWEDAVTRGYSLEYLKKIMKRSQGG